MSNAELTEQIRSEIMEYHKKPPQLVFDFRPVPKEELLQTIKSPGGSTHTVVAPDSLNAFLQLSETQKGAPVAGDGGKGYRGVGSVVPAGSHTQGTLQGNPFAGPGTITPAKPLMGTFTRPGQGAVTPARPLQGTIAPARLPQGTITPPRPLIGTMTPARPLQGTLTPARGPLGMFAPVRPVQGSLTPTKKEFKSPLAVKTENLLTDKSLGSSNDIEMLSAKSDHEAAPLIPTAKQTPDPDLTVTTEVKVDDGVDVEMLSAKSHDQSHGQSDEKGAENRAPPPTTKLVNLCPPPEENKPIDAKERLKAMLNQGARRQMQGQYMYIDLLDCKTHLPPHKYLLLGFTTPVA